jgi:hypothetical protein
VLKVSNPRPLISQLETRQLNGFIVYTRQDTWWGRFLGDYGHCYAIIRHPQQWIEVNHHFSYTNITPYPLGHEWTQGIEGNIQPFSVEIPYNQRRVRHILQPFTCVETCKSLLGIQRASIVTPYQLYRHLDGQQT